MFGGGGVATRRCGAGLPDDVVQEVEGDDDVDMAMQESMLEIIMGELLMTFGFAKARREMTAVAAATASRQNKGRGLRLRVWCQQEHASPTHCSSGSPLGLCLSLLAS